MSEMCYKWPCEGNHFNINFYANIHKPEQNMETLIFLAIYPMSFSEPHSYFSTKKSLQNVQF